MRKVPVFATVARAYGFTFGQFGTIVGLIWLPTALLVGLQYYVLVRYLNGFLAAQSEGNLYELTRASGLRYGAMIVGLVLQAILVTPVMRQALGLRSGAAFVRFEVGPTVLRVFGAMAALTLVLIVIEYITIIPGVILMAVIVAAAKSMGAVQGVPALKIAGFVILGIFLVLACGLVFLAVRLSFVVVPATVAERRIDLIRAWRLTGGNFWRIGTILIATFLPLMLLYFGLIWAALGFPMFHPLSPALLASWKSAPTKALVWIIGAVMSRMPYVFGVTFLLAPLSVGLSTGASAAAYLALVPPRDESVSAMASVPEAKPA